MPLKKQMPVKLWNIECYGSKILMPEKKPQRPLKNQIDATEETDASEDFNVSYGSKKS